MKYTLKQVLHTRYDPNRSHDRKIAERYVLLSAITKALSPLPTYVFLNLGIRPDWVTFASILFIIAGAVFFIAGNALWAVISILIFALFDSVDGDMARVKGATSYGAVLDSFGADFFYALIPMSVGFYLASLGTVFWLFQGLYIFLLGALVSLSFLLYRLINTKTLTFFWDKQGKGRESVFSETKKGDAMSLFKKAACLYRHTIVKNNFFTEPGVLLWVTVFVVLGYHEILAGYLFFLLLYNIGYLAPNLVRIYVRFLQHESRSMLRPPLVADIKRDRSR